MNVNERVSECEWICCCFFIGSIFLPSNDDGGDGATSVHVTHWWQTKQPQQQEQQQMEQKFDKFLAMSVIDS